MTTTRFTMTRSIPLVLCALLAPVTASAQSAERPGLLAFAPDDARCSNRTLRGDYAFTIEGHFVDAPTPLPVRGVAITHFDGRGRLSQLDHVVFNGTLPPVDWTLGTGTYRINADCTGHAEIIIPGSPFSPVILRLVVGDDGNQIRTVVSKPGYVVTSTATKVERSK